MAANIQVVREVPKMGRQLRTPRHSFNIRQKPWQIMPFMIAPVLPGETMKNLLIQGVARGAPLLSDQLGWWHEVYIFYVKHRDLVERDLVTEMHLNPNADMSSMRSSVQTAFVMKGGIRWVEACLRVVTQEYFRDEDESWDAAMIDGLPQANISQSNVLQSAIFASQNAPNDHELPGENPQMPDQNIPEGFGPAYEQWEHMRALGMYEATFEDYLKSFGVTPARELKVQEIHRPELLRYLRDWGYPQVKYDMGTAAVAPQMIHNISERADKDRFFAEPGFVFGVTVCRPKVYLNDLFGSASSFLDNAYSWLPAVLDDAPYTSLRRFAAGEGPMASKTSEYWVDMRDLFIYGDEFRTYQVGDPEQDATGVVDFSQSYDGGKLNAKYPNPPAAFAQLFKGADVRTRFEGVCSLSIASRLREHTP